MTIGIGCVLCGRLRVRAFRVVFFRIKFFELILRLLRRVE